MSEARSLREQVAAAFWEAQAVRVNFDEPFELASGNRSPIYVNCRLLISDPAVMSLYVEAAQAVLSAAGVAFDAAAGGETAGIPYAAYLAQASGRSMLYVRKQAKGYGIASKVEGRLQAGWRVLLVEDLITDGGSKLGFVDALRAGEAVVEDALVLFDRQQGGDRVLGEHGVTLHSVTDRATTLEVGQALSALTAEQSDEIDRYFADPERWHADRGFAFQSA
jgi:orotate phosphoribosyltransferase